MNDLLRTLVLSGALFLGGAGLVGQPATVSAVAAERTVTLAVDNLKGNCPSCAFIVRQSLSDVDGVAGVEVSMQNGTVTVIYDDAKLVDVAALSQATAAVGFPARPAE